MQHYQKPPGGRLNARPATRIVCWTDNKKQEIPMKTVDVHGAQIPALGFGTFELSPDDTVRMVDAAIQTGYRHIDTARMYRNEEAVGEAIATGPVRRDELWVTSKVWPDQFREGDLERSVEDSLEKLEMDYLDLVLLHWPNPDVPLAETIRALDRVKREGLSRFIGVSNFTVDLLNEALALSDEEMITNQIEYHPFIDQRKIVSRTRDSAMAVTAYCPLAQGRVFDDPTLQDIAEQHGKNPGQVALRWLIQQERTVAIPRTSSEDHVRDNFHIFDFALTDREMEEISRLHRPDGRIIDPAGLAPDWD